MIDVALVKTVTNYEEKEKIYQAIEEGFHLLGLDSSHYNTEQWNPLKEIVHQGDTVLIKPNLVMHKNGGEGGEECLYTQVEVIEPILDYVLKALMGSGKIYIADAPMQSCDFPTLIKESGYSELVKAKATNVPIEIVDLRSVISYVEKELVHAKEVHSRYKVVDLGENSEHQKTEDTKRYRVTCYDPREMAKHHGNGHHEYAISDLLLESDVVLNVSKPKTHRKAGFTGALKNMIGINARKEYLPHHTQGSIKENGDEYRDKNFFRGKISRMEDRINILLSEGKYKRAYFCKEWKKIYHFMAKAKIKNDYVEGSWYGNHTISKTICDINKIVYFADKEGRLRTEAQRKIFCVGDMIISGEGEGPLEPNPVQTGLILMSESPVHFDRVVARIMGFDEEKIPTMKLIKRVEGTYNFYTKKRMVIHSNEKQFEKDGYQFEYHFRPASGWRGHIEEV